MPLINVQLLEGRTPEQKRRLLERLSSATVESLEVPEAAIRIVLTEVSPEHWGVGPNSMAELQRDRP